MTSPYSSSTKSTCDTFKDFTLVGGVAFVALVGVGIPMIIVGAGRVPDEESRVVLSPWVGSNAGGLSISGNF